MCICTRINRTSAATLGSENVRYVDLVRGPQTTVQALYRSRDIKSENPPAHQDGVDVAHMGEERKVFRRYQSVFKVKSEISTMAGNLGGLGVTNDS